MADEKAKPCCEMPAGSPVDWSDDWLKEICEFNPADVAITAGKIHRIGQKPVYIDGSGREWGYDEYKQQFGLDPELIYQAWKEYLKRFHGGVRVYKPWEVPE